MTGVSTFVVRPARFEDAAFVYALSQEPSVSKWRVKQGPFSFEQHLQWWMNALNVEAWGIFEDQAWKIPRGYVRLHLHDGIDEISVAVHPKWRRMGVATNLLKAFTPNDGKHFAALIQPDNEASIGLFEKSGYVKTGTEIREGKEWLVYVK